jgi:HSP20 family protein
MAKHVNDHITQRFSHASLFAVTPHGAWTPNTDVFETSNLLVVKMELAGVAREDLEIRLDDRILVVRGERKDTRRKGPCSFRQVEIDHGYFERRIVLPCQVAAQRTKARLEEGILRIELPKAQETAPGVMNLIIQLLG